ncbi:MAG: alpha/beta fold hydrolase, partial [Marmoricola sp.]
RSLILIDTSAGPEDPEKISRYRLLASIFGIFGIKLLLGQVAPIMFSPAWLKTDAGKDTVRTWVSELAPQQRKGVKQAIRGVTDRLPITDELGAITAPTLVIVGSEDTATPPAKAEAIAAGIKDAHLDVLDGVGHVSTLEDPARVTARMREFLARQE